jgi:hypothetical protein
MLRKYDLQILKIFKHIIITRIYTGRLSSNFWHVIIVDFIMRNMHSISNWRGALVEAIFVLSQFQNSDSDDRNILTTLVHPIAYFNRVRSDSDYDKQNNSTEQRRVAELFFDCCSPGMKCTFYSFYYYYFFFFLSVLFLFLTRARALNDRTAGKHNLDNSQIGTSKQPLTRGWDIHVN